VLGRLAAGQPTDDAFADDAQLEREYVFAGLNYGRSAVIRDPSRLLPW
jgi:hypothetical protein